MKKILSIDGGGIRGLLPLRVINELEQKSGKSAKQLFDMIAGTSTGGIAACGLAVGISANKIAKLYIDRGSAIFPKRDLLDEVKALIEALYDPTPLESALKEILGDLRMNDVKDVELIIPAYCTSLPDVFFFKSARGIHAWENYLLRDVARATSAAPVYFPPAEIEWIPTVPENDIPAQKLTMIDGGVFANNPAMIAAIEARRIWPGEDILILSIGTGDLTDPIDLGAGSAIDIGKKLVDIFYDSSAANTDSALHALLGTRYNRIQIGLDTALPDDRSYVNPAMDDASPENMKRLEALAEIMVHDANVPEILEWLGETTK